MSFTEMLQSITGKLLADCTDQELYLALLELVRQKVANGERVLIYTSWTRTDSQEKLRKLLRENGYRTFTTDA